MSRVLALGRLQAIWSCVSVVMHSMFILILLYSYNQNVIFTPTPVFDFEFVEISLVNPAQSLPQNMDVVEQKNAAAAEDNAPPEIVKSPMPETSTSKDAILVKVRDKKPPEGRGKAVKAAISVRRNDSYEEKLSRYFYQYIGDISYKGSNQIKIWLKLDAYGDIKDYGFIAHNLNAKLQEQLESALKRANPMPKPEMVGEGDVVTYLLPVLLD